MQPLNYGLVRFAAEKRVARIVCDEESAATAPAVNGFSTIAAHEYRGTYFPGALPCASDQTACRVGYRNDDLVLHLAMEEPDLERVLQACGRLGDGALEDADFVFVNLVGAGNRLIQVGLQPTGRWRVFVGGKGVSRPDVRCRVRRWRRRWEARVEIPFSLAGFRLCDLESHPIPFDIVRRQAATAALTAWCPIPDQLPFNELYAAPVFRFGLLATRPISWRRFAQREPDVGAVAYSGPRRMEAGAYARLQFTYTAGRHGMQPGGGLRFNLSNEVIECNRKSRVLRRFPEKDWSALQWENPQEDGFVAVAGGRANCRFVLSRQHPFSVTATLARGRLEAGDQVRISVGAQRDRPGMRAQLLSQPDHPFKFHADLLGNGLLLPVRPFPVVRIVGRAAQALQLHCQPTPAPDEPVRLVVAATDFYGNAAEDYCGTVCFAPPFNVRGLPRTYRFRAEDRGIREFSVAFSKRGAFTVRAQDLSDSAVHGESNLIVTDGSFGPGKICFGDIHTHSRLSDGRLHPRDKCREVGLLRGCDFWGLTDHCHDLTPARLRLLNETLEANNRDGRFVTLPAYEWTGSMGYGPPVVRVRHGHRNVYFRAPVQTVFDGVNRASDTPRKLKRRLTGTGRDHILANHFHCGVPRFVPEVDELVEVSGWCGDAVRDARGASRQAEKFCLQDIWKKGRFAGVVAGSDHGSEAYHAGLPAELTAVCCEQLTRDGIFDALRAGRTYGTSGQRTLLRFSVNGRRPERGARRTRARARRLEIVVGSHLPVQGVELIVNGRIQEVWPGFLRGVRRYAWVDRATRPRRGYYTLRVLTAQGHTTWSSPLFYEAPLPSKRALKFCHKGSWQSS